MSTTFNVYPRAKDLPSFAMIVERATKELHRFLESVGIRARPDIHVRLQRCEDHVHLPFSLHDPARWDRDTYAWFMVGDVPGGTDAYFDDDADEIRRRWDGEFDDPKCKRIEPLIRECVRTGRRWWFRRSAGQPAAINLAYGLIAGSLAAITDGFVYSDDSAWDWERMPARPAEFLSWYFRPEQALEEKYREWSRRCLDYLPEELEGASEGLG
jgi:hypothetical protein